MGAVAVIPTYNERENIAELIGRILSIDSDIQILVVDDDSPDGTGEVVEAIASGSPRVELIRRKGRPGRGLAGIAGFKSALKKGFDYILEMDADFSHPPEYIPLFLKEIKDYDLVIGSREVEGASVTRGSFLRNLISRLANRYIRLILGIPVRDCTSGFRCFRREALASINLEQMISTGPSVVEEILLACCRRNYKVKEVPIAFADRRKGESKLNLFKLISIFFILLKIRFRKWE